MKPPICEVCNERFDPQDGSLIRFLADERSAAWRNAADADGRVGHPPDTAWFCRDHASNAAPLASTSTLGDALRLLRGPPTEDHSTSTTPSADTTRHERTGGLAERQARPQPTWLPDDFRRVVISPTEMDELDRRLDRCFEDLIAAVCGATGITVTPHDREVRRTSKQLASPEWRERGPASEEIEVTTVVRVGDWECQRVRSRHDWLSGGLIQSAEYVALVGVGESAVGGCRVGGGVHADAPVETLGVHGTPPAFAAPLFDELIAELAST